MLLDYDPLWDGTKSGPPYSQLAGLLAGFAFAGLVYLLTSRPTENGELAARFRNAASMLVSAFVTLAIASFLWAALSGDARYLPRTSFTAMGAAVLLGLGTAQMLVALTWMISYSADELHLTALRAFRWTAVLIGGSFTLTANDSFEHAGYDLPGIFTYSGAVVTGIFFVCAHLLKGRMGDHTRRRSLSQFATAAAAVLGTVSFFVFPADSGRWATPADVPAGWRIYAVGSTSLLLAIGILALAFLEFATLSKAASASGAESSDREETVPLDGQMVGRAAPSVTFGEVVSDDHTGIVSGVTEGPDPRT